MPTLPEEDVVHVAAGTEEDDEEGVHHGRDHRDVVPEPLLLLLPILSVKDSNRYTL